MTAEKFISEAELVQMHTSKQFLHSHGTQGLIVGPVEKGIPIPHGSYPFAEMNIGDSFSVKWKDADNSPLTATEFHSLRQKVYSARYYHKQEYGLKGRFQIKSHGNGLRVWRTA